MANTSDGSIVISSSVDTSGVISGEKEITKIAEQSARSRAMTLSNYYKKQGASLSDAMRKAWAEVKAAEDNATSKSGRAAKLGYVYAQEGLSMSEAMKKAWNVIKTGAIETEATIQKEAAQAAAAVTESATKIKEVTNTASNATKESTKSAGEEAVKNTEQINKAVSKTGTNAKKTSKNTATQVKKDVNSTTNSTVGSLNKIGLSLNSIGNSLGIYGGLFGLVKLNQLAISAASSLQEIQNVVDVTFGDLAYKMEDFAETSIEKFGMAEVTAKQMAGSFMAMGTSIGIASEEASSMALDLTGLAGDFASFYNLSHEQARTAISAVYTGETETLKRYGIVMTEANLQQYAFNLGIEESVTRMDAREKALLRYKYILQTTGFMEGDFVRTEDNWANQIRVLTERWNQLMIIMGNGLIQVLTPVINGLNELLSVLISIGEFLSSLFSSLFGIVEETTDVTGSIATSMGELADSEDDVADSADNAKHSLAGFDKLDVLQKSTASGSTETQASPLGDLFNVDTGKDVMSKQKEAINKLLEFVKAKLLEIKNLFVGGFLEGFKFDSFDTLKSEFESIGNSIRDILDDAQLTKSSIELLRQTIETFGQVSGSVLSIGMSLVDGYVGSVAKALENPVFQDYLTETSTSIIDSATSIVDDVGDFSEAIAEVATVAESDSFKDIGSFLFTLSNFVVSEELDTAFGILSDLVSFITQPIIDNQEGFKDALQNTLDVIENLLQPTQDLLDYIMGTDETYQDSWIHGFFEDITGKLSDKDAQDLENINSALVSIKEATDGLNGDGLINAIETVKTKMTELKTSLTTNFITPITELFDGIKLRFTEIKDALSLIFQAISLTVYTKLLGIKKFFEDNISTPLAEFLDPLFEKINEVLAPIKKVVSTFTTFIGNAFSRLFSGIQASLFEAINWCIQLIEDMLNGIIDMINDVLSGLDDAASSAASLLGKDFGGITLLNNVSLPKLDVPALANGTVIPPNSPFMAMLGDQTSGTNIEAPLDTIVQAMKLALGGTTQQSAPVTINLDGQTLARIQMPNLLAELKRSGYNITVLGG